MKRFTSLMAALVVALGLTGSAFATPPMNIADQGEPSSISAAEWQVFSKNLVQALQSDHEGMQQAAMRLVIQYGDKVDVQAAVFDVMRLYRDHEDEQVRRLAVVTLGQMNNKWAIRFLERSIEFEKSDTVRHTIESVVSEYWILHA